MPKRTCANTKTYILTALLSIALITTGNTQHIITGQILHEDGSPMGGVSLYLSPSSIGASTDFISTSTDFDGEFSLEIPSANEILTIDIHGMPRTNFEICGRSSITIICIKDKYPRNRCFIWQFSSEEIGDCVSEKFNLPPPDPTVRKKLPEKYFDKNSTFSNIDAALLNAMSVKGYDNNRYLSVPRGFALVTQMERMNANGTSAAGEFKWTRTATNRNFSIEEYIGQLSNAPSGHYRVFVFVVTTSMKPQKNNIFSELEIIGWSNNGGTILPTGIGNYIYSKKHKVHTLIYEFVKNENNEVATLVQRSKLTWQDHMKQSQILTRLENY